MNLRLSLQELAARHHLSPDAAARLEQLAELDQEPAELPRKTAFGLAILAAALLGLGIIFWIAANWDLLSRMGRFALLQAVIVVMCAGAIFRPAARPALALLALLVTGGLFAYFGQTYQTGADPWQLFAMWAALSLPLCLAVRHDTLWAPWALVAMTALALWIHTHTGSAWRIRDSALPYHLAGWCIAIALVFALSPAWRRYTGAGVWSMRVAVMLTCFIITWGGVLSLFAPQIAPQLVLALALLAGAACALFSARLHDTFALSAFALALNILLIGALVHLMFYEDHQDSIGKLLFIGLVAGGLLAATVKLVFGVARKHAAGAAA